MLPIANPSNLLFFADRVPRLGAWFAAFGLASVASVVLTYAALALLFRRELSPTLAVDDGVAPRPRSVAFVALGLSAVVLVVTSSLSGPLGQTAFALGVLAAVVAASRDRAAPVAIAPASRGPSSR